MKDFIFSGCTDIGISPLFPRMSSTKSTALTWRKKAHKYT